MSGRGNNNDKQIIDRKRTSHRLVSARYIDRGQDSEAGENSAPGTHCL